jgi:hypothetical protein
LSKEVQDLKKELDQQRQRGNHLSSINYDLEEEAKKRQIFIREQGESLESYKRGFEDKERELRDF